MIKWDTSKSDHRDDREFRFLDLPYIAWAMALIGTVGSLFLSEVMEFPPCTLCWYQRVAMYPLVVIIGAGIVMRDQRTRTYSLLLVLCGLAIAAYHNLLIQAGSDFRNVAVVFQINILVFERSPISIPVNASLVNWLP